MQRDPNASDKARRAERKADEKSGLITIKPVKLESNDAKPGFKKGGFKSAFSAPAAEVKNTNTEVKISLSTASSEKKQTNIQEDSDDDVLDYEYYDPKNPTMCNGDCESIR